MSREKIHRVRIKTERLACVVMPDGTNRMAKVSLVGRDVNGRVLTFTFVDNLSGSNKKQVKSECVKVYL